MATLIKIDGTKTEVFPKNKRKGFLLKETYDLIGCSMVELVGPMDDGRCMLVDEEGKLKQDCETRINAQATYMYRTCFGVDDVIVGNVLMVTDKEFR